MYRKILYGKYGVCAALIKAEVTSILPNVPFASHNPINGENKIRRLEMEGREGRNVGNGRIGRSVNDYLATQ